MEFKSLEEIKKVIPVPTKEDVISKLVETEHDLLAGKKFASQVADLFSEVEKKNGDRVANVVFNALTFQDFRKADPYLMDIESQATRLKNGLVGTLWGANVWVAGKDNPKAYEENGSDFAKDYPAFNQFQQQIGLK